MSSGIKTRNGFFRSSGTATGPTFDTYWSDTSVANVLPGAWDSPSGSADAQFGTTGTLVASGFGSYKTVLLFQFVFPAFGSVMDFANNAGSGLATWLSLTYPISPVVMAKRSITLSPTVIYAQTIHKVFQSSGALRYVVYGAPNYRSGGQLTYSTLTGFHVGAGNGIFTGTYGTNPQPQPTDYLVVETGFSVYIPTTSTSTYGYTVTYQLGDNHANFDQGGSTVAGNSGLVASWWGILPSTAVGQGAKFVKPIAPTRNGIHNQYPGVAISPTLPAFGNAFPGNSGQGNAH